MKNFIQNIKIIKFRKKKNISSKKYLSRIEIKLILFIRFDKMRKQTNKQCNRERMSSSWLVSVGWSYRIERGLNRDIFLLI